MFTTERSVESVRTDYLGDNRQLADGKASASARPVASSVLALCQALLVAIGLCSCAVNEKPDKLRESTQDRINRAKTAASVIERFDQEVWTGVEFGTRMRQDRQTPPVEVVSIYSEGRWFELFVGCSEREASLDTESNESRSPARRRKVVGCDRCTQELVCMIDSLVRSAHLMSISDAPWHEYVVFGLHNGDYLYRWKEGVADTSERRGSIRLDSNWLFVGREFEVGRKDKW